MKFSKFLAISTLLLSLVGFMATPSVQAQWSEYTGTSPNSTPVLTMYVGQSVEFYPEVFANPNMGPVTTTPGYGIICRVVSLAFTQNLSNSTVAKAGLIDPEFDNNGTSTYAKGIWLKATAVGTYTLYAPLVAFDPASSTVRPNYNYGLVVNVIAAPTTDWTLFDPNWATLDLIPTVPHGEPLAATRFE